MINQHLEMSGVARKMRFPFPVRAVGYIEDSMTVSARNFWTDKVEFCIRMESEEKEAVDQMDDTVYKTPFPHILVKDFAHVHSYRIYKQRKAFYLIYSKETALKLIEAGFDYSKQVWPIRMTPGILQLIHELRAFFPYAHRPFAADRIDILAYHLLLELFSEQYPDSTEKQRQEKISAIASLLQMQLNADLDLNTLIHESGLSRRTFFRLWNAQYKEPPHLYVMNMKLQEAARLLRETDLSINLIRQKFCFSSSSYFILVFRKKYGLTPKQYRKQYL